MMDTWTEKIASEDLLHKEAALGRAGKILRDGGLVVFPTETVYGLGGNALDPLAASKIYSAKGRPSDNPLIVHIAEPDDVVSIARACPLYYALAKAFLARASHRDFAEASHRPRSSDGGA